MKPELALLVDGDQSGAANLIKRVAALERDWQVTARVCIRNWRSSTDQKAWDDAARECRMECIQHAPETRGKNATDIELTIRAMDLLHGSGYRAFCILSGDSDFRPLARRLERGGARVVLEHLNGQPNAKASAAEKPKAVAAPPAAPVVKPAPPQTPTANVENLLRSAIKHLGAKGEATDGWADSDRIGPVFTTVDKGYTRKKYGLSNSATVRSMALRFPQSFEVETRTIKDEKHTFIRVR